MSTFLYGDLTQKRLLAEPGESTTTKAPGVTTYVDTFAALVPAEVLAVQAFITGQVVERTTTASGTTTAITHPVVLQWSFYALLAVAIGLYVLGLKRAPAGWDYVRMFIPPAAFAGWTALQANTFFDVAAPKFAGVPAQVAAVIVAVVLGVAANRLGVAADKQPPPAV